MRGEADETGAAIEADELAEGNGDAEVSQERYVQMSEAEEFLLTVAERGFGKRTSTFEYRLTGRGGKGITAMVVNDRNGQLVGSFPVDDADQIMLVSDGGQVIRLPVEGIRIVGRASLGVTLFDLAEDEKVVSVERLAEPEEDLEEGAEDEPPADA